MPAQLKNLSPPRQGTWHFLHLTRSLSPAQQEGLRAVLSACDFADIALGVSADPALAPAQRRRAQLAWMETNRAAVAAWAKLGLDEG